MIGRILFFWFIMTEGVTILGESIFTATSARNKAQHHSLFNHYIKAVHLYHNSEHQVFKNKNIPLEQTSWFYPFIMTAKLCCGTDVCRIGLYLREEIFYEKFFFSEFIR